MVGDNLSSNSNKLKYVSEGSNQHQSKLIETIDDIEIEWLKDIKIVNVTSGASTPTAVTNEVISFLKQFDYNKKGNVGPRFQINPFRYFILRT